MLQSASKKCRIQTSNLKYWNSLKVNTQGFGSNVSTSSQRPTWETWLLASCTHIQAYDNLCWCRCPWFDISTTLSSLYWIPTTVEDEPSVAARALMDCRIRVVWSLLNTFILTIDQIRKCNVKNVAVIVNSNKTNFFPASGGFYLLSDHCHSLQIYCSGLNIVIFVLFPSPAGSCIQKKKALR